MDSSATRSISCIVASSAKVALGYGALEAAYDRWLTRIYLCVVLIRGNHEPVNRLALNESIHNLRDVRAWNKKGNRKTSPAGRLDARMHYWPRLAGGIIPFIRRYSTN